MSSARLSAARIAARQSSNALLASYNSPLRTSASGSTSRDPRINAPTGSLSRTVSTISRSFSVIVRLLQPLHTVVDVHLRHADIRGIRHPLCVLVSLVQNV